ncbi:beclin-1-like protein [Schistocerca gregaria]|uniref:beclin-1-like protein n=1 Tax=Schistocerca gregaria TaxID=7010 RepID=UPI00211F1D59|nr:beclin-1-like protein [Schistocerca gregaria]
MPLCEECATVCLEVVLEEMTRAEEEERYYEGVVSRLEAREEGDTEGVDELERELDEWVEKLEELRARDARLSELERRVNSLNDQFVAEEESYWRDYSKWKMIESGLCARRWKMLCDSERFEGMLERLRSLYPLNDVFHIWHDGHFATINSYRVGTRAPGSGEVVPHQEASVALEFLAMAVQRILTVLSHACSEWEIQLSGSGACLVRRPSGERYVLCSEKRGVFSKLVVKTSFDVALCGLVCCVAEIGEVLLKASGFELPHAVERCGKVAGRCVRRAANSEESWTQCLCCLTANVKAIIWWCSENRDLTAQL